MDKKENKLTLKDLESMADKEVKSVVPAKIRTLDGKKALKKLIKDSKSIAGVYIGLQDEIGNLVVTYHGKDLTAQMLIMKLMDTVFRKASENKE